MRFLLLIAAMCLFGAAIAVAQVIGPMPMIPYSQPAGPMLGLGGPMIPGNTGGGSAPVTNDLLLEDGVSFLLLEDGVSKLCLESGC